MTTQQAGWYQDPSGDIAKLRYWNGEQWTDDYCDAPQAQPIPPQVVVQDTVYPNGTQTRVEQVYYQPSQAAGSNDETLRLIAFIFCIVSIAATFWLIIPLAWMIPMTVHCWGIYKGTKSNSVGFGVCTLFFVNTIAGILLLISKKDA